jgi:ion channel-forming bestrophin family protein
MIVKRNFSPLKVWGYVKGPVSISVGWSLAVWLTFQLTGWKELALNFTPIGVLGSALAIFVAFRNNSAYGRWWEARTLWGGIVNSSRVLARLVITFTDSHAHQPNYEKARSEDFKRVMVLRCIAWVHALRLHLRRNDEREWVDTLRPLLPADEFNTVMGAQNRPNIIQQLQGQHIYRAMADGTLGGFDSFQMEGQLLALANYQGGCERIKNTPLPRQYDFFTRMFVLLFALLLPFGILGFFTAEHMLWLSWLTVPLSVLIALVFIIMERTGAANENPFENLVTDVPLTALCNTIERDLREMLGERELPAKLTPVDGYLQ